MVEASRLRGVELFNELTDEQLDWLGTQGTLLKLPNGTVLFSDGEEGHYFYVLLEGELLITKVINGEEKLITRHVAHPDASDSAEKPLASNQYTGELPVLSGGPYVAKGTLVNSSEIIAYDKHTFFEIIARCPQICQTLLPVLAWRIRSYERQASHSALLEGLDRLAGGLMHELNNPAAAGVRVIAELSEMLAHVAEWAVRWGIQATPAEMEAVASLAACKPACSEDKYFDLIDEFSDTLAEHGIAANRQDDLAYLLADSCMTPDWLRTLPVRPDIYECAVSFVVYSVRARQLAAEAAEAMRRIESLVGAAKIYANTGGAPRKDVDLIGELEAVLEVHASHLSGITILRDYADIPLVPMFPSELNQVWTNLINNAVDAMNGEGELRIRIFREGETAIVEVCDCGPGIPPAALPKLFQPFFTTKDVGKGTGLGLYLCRDIIVHRHQGSMDVVSAPGNTRFIVRLPLSVP